MTFIATHSQTHCESRLALLRRAFSGQCAVVTGAAGFIGSHLCERLIEYQARVIGVDNLLTGQPENIARLRSEPCFDFIQHDVNDPYDIPADVGYLFHLASPASPKDYARLPMETLRVGALGTWSSLELANRKHARFLLASTSEVYGDPLEHPQRESYWGNVNPIGPRSVYDEAKRFAEALTAAFRGRHMLDAAIVRIFNTYGPRMRAGDGRAVPTFIEQACANQPITVTGDGSQTRSLCYIDDTVTGLLMVAASDLPGPVNIGNPQEVTVLQLAEQIRALSRSSSPVEFLSPLSDDPQRRCPDITTARTKLGWTPKISLREGLERTLAGRTAGSGSGGGRPTAKSPGRSS